MAGAQPYLGMPATLDDFLADRAAVVKVNPADLLPKSELVHDDGKGIPISGEGLKNKEDVPEFNSNICHAEGSYVKEEVNGEYVLGQERHILVSTGYKSYFDPIDKTPGTLGPSKQQMAVLGRTIIYLIPLVGQVIYIGETVFGYDAFTGKKLSTEQRVMNVLLLGFGIFLGSAARSASRELDAEASAEISMMNSADKEIADFTKGTESIAGDGKTILDKDVYKELEANGGYKGLEVNDGYKELEVTGGYKGTEVNDGYKEPVYEEPEVNDGYKELEENNGYKEPEDDYKGNEDWNFDSPNYENQSPYSGEKWRNFLNNKFGEDNVYLSSNEKILIKSVSEKLDKYRKNINGEDYAKTAVAYDGNNLDTVSMATSNSHQYNPTILSNGEKFNKNMYNRILEECGDESVAYSKYYEHTLTKDYIKSLPDEYFTSKGLVKDDVISEMKKLTDAIENTKNEARIAGSVSEITREPSFKEWNVENCAEVWSTRKAILNGAKFDDISFKCVQTKKGKYAPPCKNCEITFGNLNNIGKVK